MVNNKRKFIIHDLMKSGFIEVTNHEMLLLENEESGKSELQVCLLSDKNLCIANVLG